MDGTGGKGGERKRRNKWSQEKGERKGKANFDHP